AGGGLRRIEEGTEAGEDQVALVFRAEVGGGFGRGHLPPGDAEEAQPLRAACLDLGEQGGARRCVQRTGRAAVRALHRGAGGGDRLRCALHDEEVGAALVGGEDGGAPPVGTEGGLGEQRPAGGRLPRRGGEDRLVER